VFFGVFLGIIFPHYGNVGSNSSYSNSNVIACISDIDSDYYAMVGSCCCGFEFEGFDLNSNRKEQFYIELYL